MGENFNITRFLKFKAFICAVIVISISLSLIIVTNIDTDDSLESNFVRNPTSIVDVFVKAFDYCNGSALVEECTEMRVTFWFRHSDYIDPIIMQRNLDTVDNELSAYKPYDVEWDYDDDTLRITWNMKNKTI